MLRLRSSLTHHSFSIILPAVALSGFVALLFSRLLFTNQVLANGDILHYFYPYRDYAADAFRNGRIPLWNPYIFMGTPFLANPQAAVLYPLHWPLSWLPVTKQIYWSAAIHAWLLGIGGFWLMRHLRYSVGAALATAVVLAGSGFYGGLIGHINQMNGAAWLPWTILVMERWISGKTRWPAAIGWLGGCVALMLLAGHTQTAYINLFGLGLWLIFEPALRLLVTLNIPGSKMLPTFEDGDAPWWKGLMPRLAIYAAGVLLGGLLSLAQLLPTLELSGLGLRQGGLSYADASSFSLNLLKLPFTLLPTYGFIDLSVTYGTLGYSEFVAYVGLIGLLLALLGFRHNRTPTQVAALLLAAAGLFLALGRWNPFYYALYKLVPGFDLFRTPARWMMLYTMGIAILAGCGYETVRSEMAKWRLSQRNGSRRFVELLAIGLIGMELLVAARSLPHTDTTAHQAVTDMRTAVAHLLTAAQQSPFGSGAASRFLSMSTITFDPGDMAAYRDILRDADSPQIDQRAFDQFVVALKSQEILAPNLPLLWRIPSVDGFDGGVLPLQRYIQALSLFVPAEEVVPDGRLREQVKAIPDAELLSLLNVEYVITDKVQDLWYKDVYYDRQLGAQLGLAPPHQPMVRLSIPYPFAATRIDVIGAASSTEEASRHQFEQFTDKTWGAANIVIKSQSFDPQMFQLTVGGAKGAHWADDRLDSRHSAASNAEIAHRDEESGRQEYIAKFRLTQPTKPEQIDIALSPEWQELGDTASLRIQAVTLVDERTGMFQSLLPSDKGDFRVDHSGDVKIFKNIDIHPRAYLAYDIIGVEESADALDAIRGQIFRPAPVPASTTNLPIEQSELAWAIVEGMDSFTSIPDAADAVQLVSYHPEKVELTVENKAEALLVLSDSFYPGWQAWIDGTQSKIYAVNGLIRGVRLPPGKHTVSFQYRPKQWRYGLWGSGLGLVLLFVCLVQLKNIRR